MNIVKRAAAAVVMSGLLMGASVSAWAAPAGNVAAPSHAEVIAAANAPLFATESSLEPSPALQAARQDYRSNCKASHIYGADDVVGDKNTCIMGGYALPGGYGVGVAAGGR